MRVRPPSPGSAGQPERAGATQRPSQGPALPAAGRGGFFHALTAPLRFLKTQFTRRQEKQRLLKNIQLPQKGSAALYAVLRSTRSLLPTLPLETLERLSALFQDPNFIDVLEGSYSSSDPRTGIEALQQLLSSPPGEEVMDSLKELDLLLGGRLSSKEKIDFAKGLQTLSETNRLQYYSILVAAKAMQAKRPILTTSVSKEALALKDIRYNLPFPQTIQEKSLYSLLDEVLDITFCDNTQLLQYQMEASAAPPQFPGRDVPCMRTRSASPTSLAEEFRIPIKWDKQTYTLSDYSTEIYVTDPKTFETTAIKLALPGDQPLTEKEAKNRLLTIAKILSTGNQTLGDTSLNAFCQQLEKRFAQALADFNASENWPRRGFSLEQARNQSPLGIAQQGNLYLVEGQLSLLPPTIAEQHPQLAFLQEDDQFDLNFGRETLAGMEFVSCDMTYKGMTERIYYETQPSDLHLQRNKLLLKAKVLS